MRLVLRPRCSSREFCRWPCRTASVVPIIAGHAAIAAGVLYQYRCRGRALGRYVVRTEDAQNHVEVNFISFSTGLNEKRASAHRKSPEDRSERDILREQTRRHRLFGKS